MLAKHRMRRTTVWMTEAQYQALRRRAAQTDWTFSELLREGIRLLTGVDPHGDTEWTSEEDFARASMLRPGYRLRSLDLDD